MLLRAILWFLWILWFPEIFPVYSRVSVNSSRTVHYRVSLSTYPDYPAPHVRSGFGLRYSQTYPVGTLGTPADPMKYLGHLGLHGEKGLFLVRESSEVEMVDR